VRSDCYIPAPLTNEVATVKIDVREMMTNKLPNDGGQRMERERKHCLYTLPNSLKKRSRPRGVDRRKRPLL